MLRPDRIELLCAAGRRREHNMSILDEVRAYMDAHREELISDLSSLVEIPSVRGEAEEGAPYGRECRRALDASLALFEKRGASVRCDGGHYGFATVSGTDMQASESIGIFTHTDVVPASEADWTKTKPFVPYLEGDSLYGRGAEDNKAGVISALYALEALKATGHALSHPVQVFFGADEECGMGDLEKWLSRGEKMPAVSFVPDAEYPVSVGEKGICHFFVHTPKTKDILSVSGGLAFNVVLDRATVRLSANETLLFEIFDHIRSREGYHLTSNEDGIIFETEGIPAHASTPEKSKNAFRMALSVLIQCPSLDSGDKEICRTLLSLLQDDYGTGLGIAHNDTHFGRLTATNGIIAMDENGGIKMSFDVRYGAEISAQALESRVRATVTSLGEGYALDIQSNDEGFHLSDNLPYTEELVRLCTEAKGAPCATYVMGGGTYARHLPNAYSIGTSVSYKGEKPNLPEGHGSVHAPDEYVSVAGLLEGASLFAAMLHACDSLMND